LFMMICGVVAGPDKFVAIAKFTNTKNAWFAKFLVTVHGPDVPGFDE